MKSRYDLFRGLLIFIQFQVKWTDTYIASTTELGLKHKTPFRCQRVGVSDAITKFAKETFKKSPTLPAQMFFFRFHAALWGSVEAIAPAGLSEKSWIWHGPFSHLTGCIRTKDIS